MLEAKEQGAETGKRDRETEEDCLAFVRWGPQESPVHFISRFNAWLPMVFFTFTKRKCLWRRVLQWEEYEQTGNEGI